MMNRNREIWKIRQILKRRHVRTGTPKAYSLKKIYSKYLRCNGKYGIAEIGKILTELSNRPDSKLIKIRYGDNSLYFIKS